MSSPGNSFASILPLIAPDLYAKQLGIQQRMSLGQALLGGTTAPLGGSPYAGVRNAGNSILGAILTKRAMKDMSDLYSPQNEAAQVPNQQSSDNLPQYDEGQAQTLAARYGMTPSQVFGTSPQISTAQDTGGAATGNAPESMPNPGQGQGGGSMIGSASGARSIPQAMSAAIPTVPGWTTQQSQMAFITSPQAYWAAMAPTPEFKNALAVSGGNPEMAKQIMLSQAQKNATINLRPGGGALNFLTNQITTMPTSEGIQTTFPQGAGGPAQMSMVPGAAQAVAQAQYAEKYPGALLTPAQGFDASGQPTFSNQATVAGQGNVAPFLGLPGGQQEPLGIRTNNPTNMQPGGKQAAYGSPAEGILRASQQLDLYSQRGINTLAGIISNWSPPGSNNTPQLIASAAKRLGVDPNQPLPMQDPRVKGAVLDAIINQEVGPKYAAPGQPLRPSLPPGQETYLQSQAKDAAERHDGTVAAASESPMRINVLDNIISLSDSGVATGPTQEWQNKVLGIAANVPGLSKIMGGAKDNVAKFQELQKFTYQNALRNWSAAGGTGTDKQMENFAHANPNDQLFPQALQAIAKWGKASEFAIQGKANAQDQFLSQYGQNPQSQIAFERQWRNSFDPKVYQYQLMSPAEKAQFAKTVLKTPQAARAFMDKQKQLQSMGGMPGMGQ